MTGSLGATEVLDAAEFDEVRRDMVLRACKWDPQVGDVGTIADFALVMPAPVWRELAAMAESLTAELLRAEEELLHRPELHGRLGLGRRVRGVLRGAGRLGATPAAARTMRFDFHPTAEGWAISEVNSDVPGGYSEGSVLPALMARRFAGTRAAGNPGAAWADALAHAGQGRPIALLAAPGYIEDQQVIAFLEGQLRERGCVTCWVRPEDLVWRGGLATVVDKTGKAAEVGAIVRFFQAEWLDARRHSGLFVGGGTPTANPGTTILSESKRFPLLWDELRTELPTWRRLLPETRDPRDAPWRRDDSWLLKTALCNTGDTVSVRGLMGRREWAKAAWDARLWPGHWVAQRRFEAASVATARGPMYPCIGVYTVNGAAAGIYGRISPRPLINFEAIDVAVLVEDGAEASNGRA